MNRKPLCISPSPGRNQNLFAMDTLYLLSQFTPHHEGYLRLLGILVRHVQENFFAL